MNSSVYEPFTVGEFKNDIRSAPDLDFSGSSSNVSAAPPTSKSYINLRKTKFEIL